MYATWDMWNIKLRRRLKMIVEMMMLMIKMVPQM